MRHEVPRERMTAAAASAPLEFLLNGRAVRIGAAPAQTTLLDFLRAQGLTGAKEGCAEGECGACAVVMVGAAGDGSAYRPVNSCLMFLPMAANREIYTVESLAARGELSEVQQALAAAGGSQCGYCTPGFVMSLFAEQYRPDRDGRCEPLSMAGNLCRCTGYRPIRDAALALGPAPPGPLRDRLEYPAPPLERVSIQGFSRPTSVETCVGILAADAAATLVAGCTDLGVESNLGHRRWAHLVSVEAIEELRELLETPAGVKIGAALPLGDIERQWSGAPDVWREWLTLFASPPIRNRATLGGNLATASPIGDAAPLLLALDASVHVAGRSGRRTLPLSGFFTGYRQTALHPGEMLTAIEIPRPFPEFVRFYKVAKRRLDDISTVAAAMAIDRDAAGRVRRARLAFGGVAATPVRVEAAEHALAGQPWNEAAVERVQGILDRTLTPMSDHRGSKTYRLEVSKSLVEKFWTEGRR
jgi:xanthine dehydrogenase small subunit